MSDPQPPDAQAPEPTARQCAFCRLPPEDGTATCREHRDRDPLAPQGDGPSRFAIWMADYQLELERSVRNSARMRALGIEPPPDSNARMLEAIGRADDELRRRRADEGSRAAEAAAEQTVRGIATMAGRGGSP